MHEEIVGAKARIRAAWATTAGLAHVDDVGIQPGVADCAFLCSDVCVSDCQYLGGSSTIWEMNDAYGPEVTPEERRDCMVAALDAGAFDELWVGHA